MTVVLCPESSVRTSVGTHIHPPGEPAGYGRLVMRQCSRSGCSETATATLGYDYASSRAWIDHLLVDRDPHRYDLCARHANRLSVPSGWHLDDRRLGLVTPLAS